MRIMYVANVRMPTDKAHGVQIMKTCEALAELGHEIELLVPDRHNDITEDPFSYYELKVRFPLHRLPVWNTFGYGRIGFLFASFLFARAARRYLHGVTFEVVYGRDEFILARLPAPYVWESHTGAWGLPARTVARRAKRIVAISQGLKDFYIEQGVPADKLLVAHDGVDLEQFAHPQSKEEARTRLGLPFDAKIAMYIGRVDSWKGTETLFEASKLLSDVVLAVIGGDPAQIRELSRRYPDVRFLGWRPYRELADNMAAADVLVLPNTGKDDISVKFTSPLKLFAYMTSGIPIVASDLPSIREIVDELSAFLVEPDNAVALATGIRRALKESEEANARATNASERVAEYSWKRRAERIVAACSGN